MTLNFVDSVPDQSPESLGRLVGDAENALSYLKEAWKDAKEGNEPKAIRGQVLEAAERFDGVTRALGFILWAKKAK